VNAAHLSAAAIAPGDVTGEIGSLSVAGVLEQAKGAVVTVDCAPPACDRIDVAGTLRVMGGGTLEVNCPTSGFGQQSMVLFTFNAVEGVEHLAEWLVTGEICSRYNVDMRVDGNLLMLDFKSQGTAIQIKKRK